MTLPLGGVKYDPPPATLPADASPTLAAAQALWTALDVADAQAGGAARDSADRILAYRAAAGQTPRRPCWKTGAGPCACGRPTTT